MKPPQLDVENPIEVSLIKLIQGQSEPPPLTFPDISHSYLPGKARMAGNIGIERPCEPCLRLAYSFSTVFSP